MLQLLCNYNFALSSLSLLFLQLKPQMAVSSITLQHQEDSRLLTTTRELNKIKQQFKYEKKYQTYSIYFSFLVIRAVHFGSFSLLVIRSQRLLQNQNDNKDTNTNDTNTSEPDLLKKSYLKSKLLYRKLSLYERPKNAPSTKLS